jgi:prevent-host-death family protein
MSVVSIPLAAAAAPGQLPASVEQVRRDDARVILTLDGEPVAALVPVEDLRARRAG